MEHGVKVIQDTLQSIKENASANIILAITFAIIILSLAYYFYYAGIAGIVAPLRTRECNLMTEVYGSLNGKIRAIPAPNTTTSDMFSHSLRDYYIKSAYNACSGGAYRNDYVSTCVLKNLLKQGIRGLDFEIFSVDDEPVVATSTTSGNYCVKETYNYVPFAEVFETILLAFTGSYAPNPSDPILLSLRIKSENTKIYEKMANIFKKQDSRFLGAEYSYENGGKNMGETPIQNLLGKIVLIVDRANPSFLECRDFYEYVNICSNATFMRLLHYYDVKYTMDIVELIEYNKLCMTFAMPDKGSNPPNPSSVVMRECGCQMLGMRYQEIDENVEENDVFFDEVGYAFALKPEPLRYKEIVVETPPPQDPKLSYATRTISSDFYKFDV